MNNLSIEIFNKIMLYNSHPLADLFKKELKEELSEHYRILKEGPCYEPNWCADDDFLFGYETLVSKLRENNKELQMWNLHAKYNWWGSYYIK